MHNGFQIADDEDILLPLALKKYPLLAETLRKDWPAYAEFGYYNVITFAHEGFEQLLHKAVTETNIINWVESVRFPVISSRIISIVYAMVETLKHTKGIEVESTVTGNVFFRPKEEGAALEVRMPEECYLERIDQSHVPLIHSLWPNRNKSNPEISTNQLMTRVRLNGGLGLFSKENNELLSWSLRGEFGENAVTHTIEKVRRKGYAKVVECAFVNELAKQGFDAFGVIVSGNVASEALWKFTNGKVKQPSGCVQMTKLRNRE
ncbi:uncharacterized protein LOC117180543 [Belonocnema kinseyi]|uniref:uncharacterized protein LOC117180543 n=1 Tax=Belonocnema kinseyi TaxID=2817044 RepID=UPI00143D9084|nr:uncharacterized protein LOC117180543 [Belonocnema kinseyi]